MLRRTFIHADGVGPATERKLWRAGVHTWDMFMDLHREDKIPLPRLRRLAPLIQDSQRALGRQDVKFFGQRLPSAEQWRIYRTFPDKAAFVDLETTGLSADYDQITVIGLCHGKGFQVFVRGRNLDDFPRVAAGYPLLVSYNGTSFDLPFLRRQFAGFEPEAHLDLRHPLRRLGYKGGLKQIEARVGIRRPAHLREVDGFEAVWLWHDYRAGNRKALDRLIEYCREDVVNLKPLAELVSEQMFARAGVPVA